MLWRFKVTNNGFIPAILKNWPIKTSFTPPRCIEVHVQSQESERSSSHVLWYLFPLILLFFYWTLKLFRQYGIVFLVVHIITQEGLYSDSEHAHELHS
jgi:positive regulator of sigma E activity